MGNDIPKGSCVDNEDFVDAQGHSCSDNKYVNCLAKETFTRWHYSRGEWHDIMHNCPASCLLCPGEMSCTGFLLCSDFHKIFRKCEVNALSLCVFFLFTVMAVQVTLMFPMDVACCFAFAVFFCVM
jgi:hypothetical protein